MATSSSARSVSSPAKTRGLTQWQGFLGNLRQRPVLGLAIAAGCFVLIAAATYFVIVPQAWAYYHWWQAEKASADYRFDRAIDHLNDCSKVWKTSGETYYALARACRRGGDLVSARQHLQLAQRYRWPTPYVDLEYKLIQAQSGTIRSVDTYLINLVESDHQDRLLILEALVLGYLQNNFLDDAYHWVTVWIKLEPQMWQPRLLRGQALEKGQKPSLAAEEYMRVLEIHPEQPEARLRFARILLRSKQYPEAVPQYAYYLTLRPDDPDALVGLARCQRALQQFDAARNTVEKALSVTANSADAYLVRGQLEFDLEKPSEAIEWLRKAEKLDPYNLEVNQMLGVVLRDLGDDPEAMRYEQRRREIENELRTMEGLIKELLTLETGEESQGSNARNDPETRRRSAEIRFTAGTTLFKIGQEQDGVSWLLSVLQLDPNHQAARRALSAAHARMTARGTYSNPGNEKVLESYNLPGQPVSKP